LNPLSGGRIDLSKENPFQGVTADLALLNGKVITVDPHNTIVEAVAVKFDKILTVGTTDEIKTLIGPNTRVINLEGKIL